MMATIGEIGRQPVFRRLTDTVPSGFPYSFILERIPDAAGSQ